MKPQDDHSRAANPPPVPAPGGGGRPGIAETNIADGIGASLKRKRGGQPGNGNARKPVDALSTLQARIRDWKRRARAAIRLVEKGC